MDRKSESAKDTANTSASIKTRAAPAASKETALDVYMKAALNEPHRFRVLPNSGAAFGIVGARKPTTPTE